MPQYQFPLAMRKLIAELAKLPTIGEKSATRLAYHLINSKKANTKELADALLEAKELVHLCPICFGITDEEICPICSNKSRDASILCIVEKPADLIAIEKSNSFYGLYHVLHGLWSPLRGIGPEETKIADLINRIKRNFSVQNCDLSSKTQSQQEIPTKINELIIATSTTVEGDATAMFIAKQVTQFDVKVSRIAQGLPKGGELEFTDQSTIKHALTGRSDL